MRISLVAGSVTVWFCQLKVPESARIAVPAAAVLIFPVKLKTPELAVPRKNKIPVLSWLKLPISVAVPDQPLPVPIVAWVDRWVRSPAQFMTDPAARLITGLAKAAAKRFRPELVWFQVPPDASTILVDWLL